MVSRLSPAERAKGVITYSSGNHAQAVALAARMFGVPAVVVMPTTAPGIKVKGAMRLGAEVIPHGTTSTERFQKAQERSEERRVGEESGAEGGESDAEKHTGMQ